MAPKGQRPFGVRLVRNTVLWAVPAALVWSLLTPAYNQVLRVGGENLLHLIESPNVTRLLRKDAHYALIQRADFPPGRQVNRQIRLSDLHFPTILLVALFLGTPGIAARRRWSDLGIALLVSAFFHLVLVVFWVQFTYATQLGGWSLEHYGAVARNVWGLGKHVLDLPVKLALPLILWSWFYLELLLPAERPA
jgi:hypothetical protein